MSTNLDTAPSSGDIDVGTLPEECRPSKEVIVREANNSGYLYVKASGIITFRVSTGAGRWNYATAVFPEK